MPKTKVSRNFYRKSKTSADISVYLGSYRSNAIGVNLNNACINTSVETSCLPSVSYPQTDVDPERCTKTVLDSDSNSTIYVDSDKSDESLNSSASEESMNDSLNERPTTIANKSTETDRIDFILANWAVKHKIPHVAVNDLLSSLRVLPNLSNLPKDARTLLSTPRKILTKIVEPGEYFHRGLKHCTEALLNRYQTSCNLNMVEVCVNVDGLPLFKSSSSQVYPVLCNLFDNPKVVEMVGIYHGNEKPKDPNLLLEDFVMEAIDLINNGFVFNGRNYPFKVKALICDAPAKSFILHVKGHSGYFSCTKCCQEGIYSNNRVCFPSLDFKQRTNSEFALKSQEEHHLGTSILERLPGFGMVTDVPLDYMHLICLGVVRKLIVLWSCGKPSTKQPFKNIQDISNLLIQQGSNIPCEFARKPRSLSELKRWKATEFRQFLLYTGPIVLLPGLSHDRYINFLCLHVATTILSSVKHTHLIGYAQSLLQYFVKTFVILYGKENCSHNVHNLLHICEDVRKFGVLDKFSAFPFENYMQTLKSYVRKGDKPLAQIICRSLELDRINLRKSELQEGPHLQQEHFDGPLVAFSFSPQYKQITFKNFTLKLSEADNCCCLNDGSIVCVNNFACSDEGFVIIGKKFVHVEEFYKKPCASIDLGICVVSNPGHLQKWSIHDVLYKCMKLKYQDSKFVACPLLHSES